MANFTDFIDGNTEGTNVNIVDPSNPANKATVDSSGNLSVKNTDGTDTQLVTSNGEAKVNDGLRDGGIEGTLNLVTGGTTYEAKVGASRLTNRKSLTITALDDMYWGYRNTVTTSTGTPLSKNQQIIFSIDPDSTFSVYLVASGNNKNARITECP